MARNTAVQYMQPINIQNGYQAFGDALMKLGSIADEQMNRETKQKENELLQTKLDKEYAIQTQSAIDDTYMKYVDPQTGKFSQEALDKDNVGLPINQVSQETKAKQYTIQQAFNQELDKLDQLAQDTINNEVLKEATKYKTKKEFDKNVNPDLIKYADGKTMYTIDNAYGKNTTEKNKLANDKAKVEIDKKIVELKKEQNKTNGTRELKASDSNSIKASVASLYGGVYDPVTGELKGLDKDASIKAMELSSSAAEIMKKDKNITHNEAVKLAYDKLTKDTNTQNKTETNNNDPFGWKKN